jgi:hypothetical protein
MRRLQLGPNVGHTDTQSTRIWIRVFDDPASYELRVTGVGTFSFVSTESAFELGTAIAIAEGLRSDWRYHYQVMRRGRVVPGARGTFRTMPDDTSMAEVQFAFVSCNHQKDEGAWQQLGAFIEDSQPRFLLMMGDQVYLDQNGDTWRSHLDSTSQKRRQAIAQKYQDNWGREALRKVMANVPTYMIWDDHDIRDGWGSWAAESPTLTLRYPRGEKIFRRHDAFFADARDVYLHFQMSHNPPVALPLPGQRKAMPVVLRCGRVLVLMLDSRGERDPWRREFPVLGAQQWEFIETLLANLPADVDTLAVVTPAPIATLSPHSAGQLALGDAQTDVRLFRRGDMRAMDRLINDGGRLEAVIDEVRDQWSHHLSRPEQERLIRQVGAARFTNRLAGSPRAVAFLGGDIHLGGIWDISASKWNSSVPCIVSSGISQLARKGYEPVLAVDQDFEVAPGIRSKQRLLIQTYNFGVMHVVPTGGTPVIVPTVVPQGKSRATSGQLGGVVG